MRKAASRFSLTIDRDWRIRRISPSTARWGGSTPRKMLGADCRKVWPLPPRLAAAITKSFQSGAACTGEFDSALIPGRRVDARIVPFDGGAHIAFRDVTDLVSRAPGGITGASEPLLAGPGTAEIALLDERGVIVSVNGAWRASAAALSPTLADAGVGMRYVDLCLRVLPALKASSLGAEFEALLGSSSPVFRAGYRVPDARHPGVRQVQISRLLVGETPYFIAIHEDLTAQQNVAAELRETSAQLLRAQEDERQRIALELHDSTAQNLAALAMSLARLRRLIGAAPEAAVVLDEMSAIIQDVVGATRAASFLMASPDLARLGLKRALERLVKGFGRRAGLESEFSAYGPVDEVSGETQHAVFRLIQEALANAYRHSHGTRVAVEVGVQSRMLTAKISDNGRGMRQPSAYRDQVMMGVGILGMRARMEQLGGALEIATGRRGTTVLARVPASIRPAADGSGGT